MYQQLKFINSNLFNLFHSNNVYDNKILYENVWRSFRVNVLKIINKILNVLKKLIVQLFKTIELSIKLKKVKHSKEILNFFNSLEIEGLKIDSILDYR